jgi:O-antigen/teichoic acid export membrane protein
LAFRLPHGGSPSWVLAETATSASFAMLSMLLVGREIGPQAMGLGTLALAAFVLFDVLAACLFTDALVQHPRLGPNHAGSAATAAALVGAGGAVVLAGISPLLAAVSNAPEVAALSCALAALLPMSAWSGAISGLALRQHRFRLLAARALIGQPVALGAGLLAAAGGFGPWALIANQATATLVTFGLFLLLARRGAGPRLDRAALRDLWPVAGPQIAAIFVSVGKYRLFVLALGLVAGHTVVALSHAAFRLLDGTLIVVLQSVARIGVPRLCAERGDRARLAQAFGELAQLQALLGLPVAVGTALVAPAMVHALLGPDWREAGQAAQVVGFAASVGLLAGDAGSLFLALGKAKRNLYLAVVSLVVPLALLLAVRPSTAWGVALCWASQSVLLAPAAAWLALRELRRSPWWLLRSTAPALLATGCMAAAVLALQATVAMTPGAELLASVACGGAVYLAVAAALLRWKLPFALMAPRIAVAAE